MQYHIRCRGLLKTVLNCTRGVVKTQTTLAQFEFSLQLMCFSDFLGVVPGVSDPWYSCSTWDRVGCHFLLPGSLSQPFYLYSKQSLVIALLKGAAFSCLYHRILANIYDFLDNFFSFYGSELFLCDMCIKLLARCLWVLISPAAFCLLRVIKGSSFFPFDSKYYVLNESQAELDCPCGQNYDFVALPWQLSGCSSLNIGSYSQLLRWI
jgi:hypothetical protein